MENSLLKLIASMSPAEKRQFILSTKKQVSSSKYLDLFKLIDKHKNLEWISIKEKFKAIYPTSAIESTASYLNKLLIDILIQNKLLNDETYKLLYGLLQIKVLQERNLSEGAYSEIKRNILLASKYQELPLLHLLKRKELNYLSDINFKGIKEKDLIAKQVVAKDILRNIRNTQEHYTLYELLKHRLSHTSQTLSDETKTKLNDLVLSEIAIINTNIKGNVESKKLHLLFQSFFFIKTGDYRSALKTFYVLNELYEKNLLELQRPPIDYFSMLDGILDSLRMIDHHLEMEYFLQKLNLLDSPNYPDYFRLLTRKTMLLTKLRILTSEKKWTEISDLIKNTEKNIISYSTIILPQKQSEMLFLISLSFYNLKNLNKAIKYVNAIILNKSVDYSSPIYRIARLFNLIMYYENRDLEYLGYEIRSYKRIFKGKIKPLLLEKLIFKVVKIDPKFRSKSSNSLTWTRLLSQKEAILNNKHEQQILKYFDFLKWCQQQLFF